MTADVTDEVTLQAVLSPDMAKAEATDGQDTSGTTGNPPMPVTSVDALSGVEEEVYDARTRPDQQGSEPGDEHGTTADVTLLVVLPV